MKQIMNKNMNIVVGMGIRLIEYISISKRKSKEGISFILKNILKLNVPSIR